MSSSIFRVFFEGVRIAYHALVKSIAEEIKSSQEAARMRYQNNPPEKKSKDITLLEAKQILDLRKIDPDLVERKFKHLFEANKRRSLYLQSKVFRAKKRLEGEINNNVSCKKSK